MTDRAAIAVGDLAVVVRLTPCCGKGRLGRIVKITGFVQNGDGGKCLGCGASRAGVLMAKYEGRKKRSHGFSVSRLKRIPPLSELEGSKTDEPMKEPA